MFDRLSARLGRLATRLRGLNRLSEANIEEALRETRLALLEADTHIKVTRDFIESVRKEAIGSDTIEGLAPGQTLVKIVHEKLIELLGSERSKIAYARRGATKILMVGTQGSGKTTSAVKLARLIQRQGYRPLLVSVDASRPAAADQLRDLAKTAGLESYEPADPLERVDPERIVAAARKEMESRAANVLIVDSAGRLSVDEEMLDSLARLKSFLEPDETLYVADAMTGQDGVNSARAFNERVGITGALLTKLDGAARAGAALSIRAVTGAPIKFVGIGEKVDQLEEFHPDRIAGRILGMGDILTLIEKTQANIDQRRAAEQSAKTLSGSFDLEDFLEQIRMVRKMGPLDQLVKLIPGIAANARLKAGSEATDPDRLKKIEAIISSMTPEERRSPAIVGASRKRRIAAGSGVTIGDVNKMLRSFDKARKMARKFGRATKGGARSPGEAMRDLFGAGA